MVESEESRGASLCDSLASHVTFRGVLGFGLKAGKREEKERTRRS